LSLTKLSTNVKHSNLLGPFVSYEEMKCFEYGPKLM